MSVAAVRTYLKQFGKDDGVMEFGVSSATVELAAQALHVIPARISKTLSFRTDGGCLLILMAGDARIDNKKFKEKFTMKARMLTPQEALEFTGHPVGGVCPFAIPAGIPVYLDISMKRFHTVFPACGSGNSAIELTCDELFTCAAALEWVDVCKDWQGDQEEQ